MLHIGIARLQHSAKQVFFGEKAVLSDAFLAVPNTLLPCLWRGDGKRFRRQLSRGHRQGGARALAALWLAILADLAATALLVWLDYFGGIPIG
ncbi:MAG: hypothetical protein MI924_38965 [Chloroflexales bacterium]|nr:hypothetical protein [Chloroflexales bacterium]